VLGAEAGIRKFGWTFFRRKASDRLLPIPCNTR